MTAHRILIATAIVFFFGYAGWELAGTSGRSRGTAGRAALSALGGVVLAFYFRSLKGK